MYISPFDSMDISFLASQGENTLVPVNRKRFMAMQETLVRVQKENAALKAQLAVKNAGREVEQDGAV